MKKATFLFFPFAALGLDLANLPANSWTAAPNTRMDAVDPCPARNCSYSGVEGIHAVMNDWCGGVYDSKRTRLVVWGGGHNGYYGNELYAFEIDSMKWKRITEPSTSISFNQDPMADGKPVSRHTYGGIAYIAHADRLFGLGGSIANQGGNTSVLWTFDFGAKAWENRGGGKSGAFWEAYCSYDSASRKVYYGSAGVWSYTQWGLYSYDVDANQWSRLDPNEYYYAVPSAIDRKRGLLFFVGDSSVRVYNIRDGNYTAQTWATTGGNAFVSKTEMGLEYDPVSDRIVGWDGGAVYALNPDTKAWTAYNAPGAPTPNSNGTYGRWRYVPKYNVFAVANHVDQNVYFYKLTAGGGTTFSESVPVSPVGITITVSPNPVRSGAVITLIGVPDLRGGNITILDTRGSRVSQSVFTGQSYDWRPGKLPAGVYLLKVQAGASVMTAKILVEK